jgi:hypothetical protein
MGEPQFEPLPDGVVFHNADGTPAARRTISMGRYSSDGMWVFQDRPVAVAQLSVSVLFCTRSVCVKNACRHAVIRMTPASFEHP